jgi:hypothetical protein
MRKLFYCTAAALIAGSAFVSTTSASPVSGEQGITQDLSARVCRTVVTHRWSHGRRIAVRKSVCSGGPGYVARPAYYAPRVYGAYASSCRTVVKTKWSNGRRVTVRSRVC